MSVNDKDASEDACEDEDRDPNDEEALEDMESVDADSCFNWHSRRVMPRIPSRSWHSRSCFFSWRRSLWDDSCKPFFNFRCSACATRV